ncbi:MULTISPECIES: anthranilate synthase component II [Pasteurellaceae]|uniref:Anthranilate synthase component II n=1 Tax=Pasteurella atlantica TaxID=2827233 RepID=A0AAW8CQ89_9PAST|nr:anthranilate synthase component II [Pasteurella atlantica]MBR0574556.1 anthranilate synthase component II [Pasteurella atlantica]MDP8040408.1 anthranilate synthase component II [Pasteurella atlantica]MDP8042574.1 anthranilate synthase component II [Pasteurella atlantica]MDP8044676.1 anthranilate synthase component II [Pasteurella atlantica]MDP8046742.1 anthranilate synthase component II [Pasteurella atlantica]
MILIIDNHDSFTFNLVDLFRKIKVQVEVVSVENLELDKIEKYSHILISPGPDVPSAYPILFEILQRYSQTKSILGVCLGHQVLCEFFGGQLYNLNRVRHGQKSQLRYINKSPIFKNLPATFNVGLYHSWAVLQNSLNNSPLEVTAICDENIVMAVQHQNLPIYGVQFHPESFMTEFGRKILQNWLDV